MHSLFLLRKTLNSTNHHFLYKHAQEVLRTGVNDLSFLKKKMSLSYTSLIIFSVFFYC